MDRALELAKQAALCGEVPVGAVILRGQDIIAEAHNETRGLPDPTAHAEILAIRRASQFTGGEKLSECDLYVTLEPCAMCAGAIASARLRRVYFAAPDPKSGGILQGPKVFNHAVCHHKPDIYYGMREDESVALLQQFFQQKRLRLRNT